VQIGFSPTLYEVEESSGVVTFFVENRNPEMEREVTLPLKAVLKVCYNCSIYTMKGNYTLSIVQMEVTTLRAHKS